MIVVQVLGFQSCLAETHYSQSHREAQRQSQAGGPTHMCNALLALRGEGTQASCLPRARRGIAFS